MEEKFSMLRFAGIAACGAAASCLAIYNGTSNEAAFGLGLLGVGLGAVVLAIYDWRRENRRITNRSYS